MDDNRHCDDDADDDVLGSCSDTYKEWSTECHNMMLDAQMQYENSKNSRAGICEDYDREKYLERKNIRSVHKKVRRKVNTEMDHHTKVVIYTNELKKYVKAINELEEQNFGSLLNRIITKCDLNALLFGENTEIV